MGIEEIILITAAQQVAQGTAAFLSQAMPGTTNPWALAACKVGIQLANNVVKACDAGLQAATAEFNTTQIQEKKVVTALAQLPPIT